MRRLAAMLAGTAFFIVLSATIAVGQLPFRYVSLGNSPDDINGRDVGRAGDVNNDGFADYIVGIPGDDTNGLNAGSAAVYSGVDGTLLHTFFGVSANDQFGTAVDAAGDVNNDGFDDVIVGAFLDDDAGMDAGSVTVFSGLDGSILYKIDGTVASDNFGISVCGLGDINNDSHDDFAVGAWLADAPSVDSGAARVFSGIDGSPFFTFLGDGPGDQLGTSIANAGDVNNDGINDIIIGAVLDDDGGFNSGMARVYSGGDGGVLYTKHGSGAIDLFGLSVDGCGDVNNDGFDDFIVGAMLDDNNGADSGSATVYSGQDGTVIYVFDGAAAGDNLGYSVAGVGDVNDDGVPDFACGAPAASVNGTKSGSALFYNGNNGSIIQAFHGFVAGDEMGTAIAGIGDCNNDGFSDALISAPFQDLNGINSGLTFVISIGGARSYGGTGNPFYTLTAEWIPDGVPGGADGILKCSGAVPGAAGLAAVSLAPANTLIFGGFPLLIAADAFNLQASEPFGFDFFGEVATQHTLQSSFTAGVLFYVQYFSNSPVPAASNGVEVLVVK
ncbi:MAG: hypothetical protein ACI97A_003969 [Planctomycetota bacterium]|jgi:hypothetical protein